MNQYSLPANGQVHVGTFIKTASPHVVEVLGLSRLDFGVIDAEHGPFDRSSLDLALLAARCTRWPVFVRVAEASASAILAALDMGASGVLVPHVDTPEQAAAAVSASRYVGGTRGYSGSSRHGGYGTRPMRELIPAADRCVVVCQIESPAAVKNAPAIAQVSGVDAVFIGRGDLAVSMGIQDTRHPAVADLARQAIAGALAAGKAVGMYVGSTEERQEYMAQGVTWFVQGSDQSLLRDAANRMAVAA